MTDVVVPAMKGVAKAIYGVASVLAVDGDAVTLGLNAGALERGEKSKRDVEAALSAQLGRPVSLNLTLAGDGPSGQRNNGESGQSGSGTAPGDDVDDEDDLVVDISDLEDADVASTGVERLTAAFPGAEIFEEDEGPR